MLFGLVWILVLAAQVEMDRIQFWLSWILSWCRISPSLFRSSPCCPPKWSTWSRKTSWTCCPPKGSTWPDHRCGFIAFFTLGGLRCLSMFALKTCKLLQTIFCSSAVWSDQKSEIFAQFLGWGNAREWLQCLIVRTFATIKIWSSIQSPNDSHVH